MCLMCGCFTVEQLKVLRAQTRGDHYNVVDEERQRKQVNNNERNNYISYCDRKRKKTIPLGDHGLLTIGEKVN